MMIAALVPALALALLSSFVQASYVPSTHSLHKRQCAATLATATSVADRLQSHDFNAITGEYSELWTDANSLEDVHNLMLGEGTTTWDSLADTSYIGRIANTGVSWSTVLGGSNDDAQWVILALYKMADYRTAHGGDSSAFMSSAASIYDIVSGQWDDTCGGGVWWSTDHTYKNAITNELFLLVSAEGYIRTGNSAYLDNANKAWTWLSQSGMRNSDGLWNDGLDSTTCQNNGQTTWIYNQGVIASGLSSLASITGNTSLLDQAEITLDATISHLTTDNILKESCDDVASGGTTCNLDQQIFKGVWMKHLQYYLDRANSASRTAKYEPFIGAQYSAVYHYGIDASEDVSSTWYAANQGGGAFTAQSQTSGLAAVVAAAKYGPC